MFALCKSVSIFILVITLMAASAFAQNEPKQMSINIVDPATSAGLADVRIRWRDFRNGMQNKGEALTGNDGLALIPMPRKGVQFFQLYISKPGFVTLRAFWPFRGGRGMVGDVRGTDEPPDTYEVIMEPATKASGKVVDENNQPVEGATVFITANKKITTPNLATDILRRKIKTGADGVFSIDDAPSPIDVAEIGVFHPLFANDAKGFSTVRDYQTPEKLLDGSAVFTIGKGVIVEGTVTSPDGKPAIGATIIWGNQMPDGQTMPEISTDSDGKYSIGSQLNTSSAITVKARGFAPEMRQVEIKKENIKLDIQLRPARKITGRVVPPAGQHLGNGYVYIYGWRGVNTINQQIWFGGDGRFIWTEAPYEEIDLYVKAYGFPVISNLKIKPEDKDVTINLGEPDKQ